MSVLKWNASLSEPHERVLRRVADLGERAFIVLLFIGLVIRIGGAWSQRPADIAVVALEFPAVLFIVFRRRSDNVSDRPFDWLIGLVGTAAPMLVAPGGNPIINPNIGVALLLTGLILATASKLALNRSFGVVAANRGVVRWGPYRFVRHPIYTGYVITYIGFLLNNPTGWNLAVYLCCFAFLYLRIAAEERVLKLDPIYAAFMQRVPYRMAPGIY
jgi:protein-S-isoprenylcysteine O-methyltransferase Ste14